MNDASGISSPAGPPRTNGVPLDMLRCAQIRRATVFIERNLAGRLAIADVARVACYAPRHFQRLFQQVHGETVHDYIRRLRAERAAALLSRPRVNVTEAALLVGFRNSSGLYKAFRKRFGRAPSEFLPAVLRVLTLAAFGCD